MQIIFEPESCLLWQARVSYVNSITLLFFKKQNKEYAAIGIKPCQQPNGNFRSLLQMHQGAGNKKEAVINAPGAFYPATAIPMGRSTMLGRTGTSGLLCRLALMPGTGT